MEPEGSSPYSQQPYTCPYPKPRRYSPCPQPTSRISILILSSHLRLFFQVAFFPKVLSLKPCIHLSSPPHVLYVLPISVFLIWSSEWYLVRSTEHKVPHYVVFSTPLSPRHSYAQISSSAPYSLTPSAYVSPSMWATTFHTHTKQPWRL